MRVVVTRIEVFRKGNILLKKTVWNKFLNGVSHISLDGHESFRRRLREKQMRLYCVENFLVRDLLRQSRPKDIIYWQSDDKMQRSVRWLLSKSLSPGIVRLETSLFTCPLLRLNVQGSQFQSTQNGHVQLLCFPV